MRAFAGERHCKRISQLRKRSPPVRWSRPQPADSTISSLGVGGCRLKVVLWRPGGSPIPLFINFRTHRALDSRERANGCPLDLAHPFRSNHQNNLAPIFWQLPKRALQRAELARRSPVYPRRDNKLPVGDVVPYSTSDLVCILVVHHGVHRTSVPDCHRSCF